MRTITVTIHRVQTTDYDVDDDFDHDGDLDRQLNWDYLAARLHQDTDILSIRTTEGAIRTVATGGDLYIVVEGGLVTNDPMLPVLDLDVLDTDRPSPHDADCAAQTAIKARRLGLSGIVDRLEVFAAQHRADPQKG